ncbi:MAG: type II toxin-antitoxin system RelE/ParE family toxin [Thiofilum sp.]|uniref:type II toxin-antitoxin system RelE/ParE family toxin n=1 Tax=Thiofilum sp. TaxID=2212733 RepID=UPI0025FF142F|nr:type II toxin-antitoxin system RelE/ParE family toxin [Thiofilum sp.]MBK8453313.1 type II toxin-antitoxin system RelE/ParE family toxin [Thiofilum sp.]
MNTLLQMNTYIEWFDSLRDKQAKARILARLRRVELDNFGDYHSVGEGVSELRIHYGQGYRIYFMQHKKRLVILLAGGNKSTQDADIATAIQLASNLKELL